MKSRACSMSATAAVSVISKTSLAGIDSARRDLLLHVVWELGVSHRPAREVHLQGQFATLGLVGRDQPDGLLGHPAVDVADQPEALRGLEESTGLDQAPAAVLPHAEEDLVLSRLPV